MGAVEIPRVEDIQPGDHVTLVWNGDNDATTVWGIVRLAATVLGRVRLGVGDTPFWLGNGPRDWHVAVATREVPDAPPLPTEPGSVIVNATIRGETGHTAFLVVGGDWLTLLPVDAEFIWHRPEHITAWEPARIVPESEAGRTGVEVES